LLAVAGCGGGSSSSPSSTQYKPSGNDIIENSTDWGILFLYDNTVNVPYDYLGVLNNVWNKVHAASGPKSQKVFLETINGKQACGWQWEWAMSNDVVAYPELISGAKPWDTGAPFDRGGKFPFLAGTKDLTANFDIRLEAEGKYNMAFTMWAVSNPDTGAQSITHEVMIWNYNHGCTPAGTKRGTVTVDGVDFDVYVNENQHDNSGGSSAVWKYVAFVAKSPVLHGPFHLSQFIDYMIQNNIMSNSDYICSFELGNEIVGGSGITEIQNFSLDITDKT
jgi:hypothetical protein